LGLVSVRGKSPYPLYERSLVSPPEHSRFFAAAAGSE
jgi:hypothetical protein